MNSVAQLSSTGFGRAAVAAFSSDVPKPIKQVATYALLHRDGTDAVKGFEPRPVTDQVCARTLADMADMTNGVKPKRQVWFRDGLRESPEARNKDFERPAARTILRSVTKRKAEFDSHGLTEVVTHAAAVAELQLAKPNPNEEVRSFEDRPGELRGNFKRLEGPGDDAEDQQSWSEFRDHRPVNPFDPDGPREVHSRPPPFKKRLDEALERREDFGAVKPGKDSMP